jgi:hypothetical protein
MRGLILLLPLVLAACGTEQPNAPQPASTEPDAIEPGLWTINRNVLSQKVGSGARDIATAPTGLNVESKCLASPISQLVAIQFMTDTTRVECRHEKTSLADGKVKAELSCTPPPNYSEHRVTATGDYTPTSFSLTVETKAKAVPPAEDVEQKQAFDGKLTGTC